MFVGAKGGVGKTTSAMLTAAALQAGGANVCVLDTDPQGSAAAWADHVEQNAVPLKFPCGVSRFLDSLVMRPGSHVLFVVPMLVLGFGIPARSGDGSGCRRLRCTQRLYGGQGLD